MDGQLLRPGDRLEVQRTHTQARGDATYEVTESLLLVHLGWVDAAFTRWSGTCA